MYSQSNITITGGGTINGQGAIWWACSWMPQSISATYPCSNKERPMLINAKQINGLVISNLILLNSPMFNINMDGVNNGHFYNLNITAPSSGAISNPSHNTDGIDIGNSTNILVENSYISVGDVHLLAESSWQQTKNITFRNLTLGTGHGMAIVSVYSMAGIQDVLFQDIVLTGSDISKGYTNDAGVMVIGDRSYDGLVQNVTYKNIQINSVTYCITVTMNFSRTYIAPGSHTPVYNAIYFNNVTCNNAWFGYNLEGLFESQNQVYINQVNYYNLHNASLADKYTSCSCANSNYYPPCCAFGRK